MEYRVTWRHEMFFNAESDEEAREIWDSIDLNRLEDEVHGLVEPITESVWDSVEASVWDSVEASVWDSVEASVWDDEVHGFVELTTFECVDDDYRNVKPY